MRGKGIYDFRFSICDLIAEHTEDFVVGKEYSLGIIRQEIGAVHSIQNYATTGA
jgi:hypothetical protein